MMDWIKHMGELLNLYPPPSKLPKFQIGNPEADMCKLAEDWNKVQQCFLCNTNETRNAQFHPEANRS